MFAFVVCWHWLRSIRDSVTAESRPRCIMGPRCTSTSRLHWHYPEPGAGLLADALGREMYIDLWRRSSSSPLLCTKPQMYRGNRLWNFSVTAFHIHLKLRLNVYFADLLLTVYCEVFNNSIMYLEATKSYKISIGSLLIGRKHRLGTEIWAYFEKAYCTLFEEI